MISTLNGISTECVFHYAGVSRLLEMRFGNDLLADVILRQSFQMELLESSPKAIASWVAPGLGPLKNIQFRCLLLVPGILLQV